LDKGTINKRPGVQIEDHEPLHRGETVTFKADITDANDKFETLSVEWHVGETCELASSQPMPECKGKSECDYTVPAQTKESVCIMVQVTDSYSASNLGSRLFHVENRAPQAKLERIAPVKSAEQYALLTDFIFSARNSKDDDPGDQDHLVYTWKVMHKGHEIFPPGCKDASKPDTCSFTVDAPGDYQVTLTVKDSSLAVSAPATEDLVIDEDRPPCIRSYNPPILDHPILFAASNNTFAVIQVDDDVNPFPVDLGVNTSQKTAGTFKWSSRKNPTDDFTRSTNMSNQLPFLQGSFKIGDQMQIRVEYQDGQHSLASCDPNATVCSLNKDDCVQWITWTVLFQ
jgi:hypothetical protein